jgi:type VI secretion system secreted protein VgrG
MTVVGPSGAEIHTDEAGRIKARFRWDRRSPEDDRASAWVRPLQPPLSGGFFLPRAGWEVLVGFMSEPAATGDTPIELGRLMNGTAPPAESLPAQKVRSSWGTLTTPGGGKQNQLRFDDAAGAEGLHVAASKDYNERTGNDKVVTVTSDETNTVGGNHINTVTLQQESLIKGAQTYSVGGDREVTTVGALGISAASEAVTVGGVRKFQVGGDFETKAASVSRIVGAAENVVAIVEANRHVTGASTIAVGATWAEVGGVSASTGVLGASTLTVAGPLSVRAANASINASVLTETYAGVYRGHAGGKLTLKAPTIKLKAGGAFKAKGAHVFFKATRKIVVNAGGVTITITPGSIKVKGKLNGDATSVVTGKEEVG